MSALAAIRLHICGAGALGSNLAVNLARTGFQNLCIIDRDRVEEHNVGTQVYAIEDVGGQKAEILKNLIFREVGIEIKAHANELSGKNVAKLLKDAQLVIDTFDNSASRRLIYEYCREKQVPCLHAGVNDAYGEVRWNEQYIVPNDGGLDVCDYPLTRSLVLMVTAVASEAIIRFAINGVQEDYSITTGDLRINREGANYV